LNSHLTPSSIKIITIAPSHLRLCILKIPFWFSFQINYIIPVFQFINLKYLFIFEAEQVMENQDRILEFCRICKHYSSNGACGVFEVNIKSYPEKFYSKCDGKYFVKLENISDESYLIDKFYEEVLNKPDFEEEVTNFVYPHLHEDNLKGKAQRKVKKYNDRLENYRSNLFDFSGTPKQKIMKILAAILGIVGAFVIGGYLKGYW
jgi:hypothetical protein